MSPIPPKCERTVEVKLELKPYRSRVHKLESAPDEAGPVEEGRVRTCDMEGEGYSPPCRGGEVLAAGPPMLESAIAKELLPKSGRETSASARASKGGASSSSAPPFRLELPGGLPTLDARRRLEERGSLAGVPKGASLESPRPPGVPLLAVDPLSPPAPKILSD
jgi:hypothetical protein